MSWLRRELGVASQTGIAISALLALVAVAAWSFAAQGFPVVFRVAFAVLLALLVFVYGCLVAYVYGDARRRGMRHVLWAVVAAVVPNALGLIAYFLLREPMLQPCAACGTPARRGLAFCPRCGASLAQTCAACRRALEPGWSHCGHCGAPVSSPSPAPTGV
jgi:predicted amidophosphoribosyltransferase